MKRKIWLPLVGCIAYSIDKELYKAIDYLREQVRVLVEHQEKQNKRIILTNGQRMRVAAKAKRLSRKMLEQCTELFTAATVMRWYNNLVAEKYDGSGNRSTVGRPPITPEIVNLVIKFKEDNPRWALKVLSEGGIGCKMNKFTLLLEMPIQQRPLITRLIYFLVIALLLLASPIGANTGRIQKGTMAGYLLVPHDKVPETYNAGFSMYVAAWPLLREYPGNRFQTGLFGTWMHAQYDQVIPDRKLYSDIEGGLGWWRDTRFATETPKFIMGGVALNFCEWANGPGAGKGRDWNQPKGKYGVAQLSPWLLWPPDGLNLKQGTCGQLFGYGYLPLPLTEPKSTTAGKKVPTGNQCWTLFLNTANFKGPVAFFVPYFWSRPTVDDPELAGLFLDTRPSKPNKPLQMETQYVPSVQAADTKRQLYARIAPTSFPRSDTGVSPVVHRMTSYSKKALWDKVDAWFKGGPSSDGLISPSGAAVHTFPGRGGATWKIYTSDVEKEKRAPVDWKLFASPIAIDQFTYGFRWNEQFVTQIDSADGPLYTLPEYYRLVETSQKARWVPVKPNEIPAETGLTDVSFTRPVSKPSKPYITPEETDSCWKTPGPVAGPFYAEPGDGSVVTYYWYRFADQPALLNADLTGEERQSLQLRVEKIHRNWKKDHSYLPPPTIGQLAKIAPALIVTPPPGLEIGYIPVATRQAAKEEKSITHY